LVFLISVFGGSAPSEDAFVSESNSGFRVVAMMAEKEAECEIPFDCNEQKPTIAAIEERNNATLYDIKR
jgi:hypothetical protein